MRNKALLCLAAFAATAIPAMAQVYSANIVGYVNLNMPAGYSLVANQLVKGTNGLNQVLPTVPTESLVLKYANNAYTTDVFDGTSWLDNVTGAPTTTKVSPGEGFFFFNPAAAAQTVTLVGEVTTGNNLTVPMPAGYSLVSSIVPQSISLTSANGFPQVAEMLYLSYAGGSYTTLVNDGTGWLDNVTGAPATAAPAVGQGFFIFNPGTTTVNWTRNFVP